MQLITADTPETQFPSPDTASEDGLVAVGGEITVKRVLSAYRQGIFPWYSDDQPVLWWSPEPRAILYPDAIKISRSLAKVLRSGHFHVTADHAFEQVIRGCASPRSDGGGTWITDEMMKTYIRLHQLGYGHSIEVWHNDVLVGGLYGLGLGAAFFGESMFSKETNASKVALVELAAFARRNGIDFIDCQLPTAHLTSMGAVDISREKYMAILEQALQHADRTERWQISL